MMKLTIMKKEMKCFFRNPLNYLIAGVIALMAGWMFFNLLVSFANNIQGSSIEQRYNYDFINVVVIKFFGNINFLLLFLAPILSMKLFTEELKTETINMLLTSKVSLVEIVLNKYLSAVLQGVFFFLFTICFFIILGRLETIDYSVVLSSYIGLLLNLCLYLSIGIFSSSLSKNIIVSALISFTLIMFLWSIALFSQMTSNYLLSLILKYFSVIHHFENLVKGSISTVDIFYYFSGIFFFVFLTLKSLALRTDR